MIGYATFNYEESDYRVADLIKVIICVNGDPCDPLSFVSHSSKVTSIVVVIVVVIVIVIVIVIVVTTLIIFITVIVVTAVKFSTKSQILFFCSIRILQFQLRLFN